MLIIFGNLWIIHKLFLRVVRSRSFLFFVNQSNWQLVSICVSIEVQLTIVSILYPYSDHSVKSIDRIKENHLYQRMWSLLYRALTVVAIDFYVILSIACVIFMSYLLVLVSMYFIVHFYVFCTYLCIHSTYCRFRTNICAIIFKNCIKKWANDRNFKQFTFESVATQV